LNNITRVNGSFNISNVTSKTEISGFTISENPGWWGLHSGIGISDSDTVTIDNNTFLCGGIWANNTPINLYDNAFKSGVYNDYRCGAVFRNLPDYPGLWMYPQIWDSVIKTRYTVSAVGNTFDNSTSFTVWGGYDVLSSNNRINGIYTSIGGTVKSVSGITGTVSMEVGRDPATTADPESYMEPTRLGSVVRIDDFTYEVILDNGQRTRVAVPTFNSSAVYSDAYNNVYNSSYQQKYREALAIAMQNASDNIPTDDYIVQQAQEYAARWVRDQAAQAVNALNSIYNDAYNNSMYTAQSIYNYDYAQQASDYDEAYRNYYASVYNDLYQNSFTAAYNEATGWGYDDSAALSYASAYAESQDYAGSSGYNLQSLSSDYAAQYVQARADEIQSMVDSYGRDAGYQALSDWANNLSMYSVSTYENLLDKNSLISAFASGESYDYLYSQIYDQLSSNGSVAEDAHNQGVSSAWNGYINGSVYNNYFYQGYMQSYDTGYANSYAERQVEQYAQSQAKSQAESYAASYAQSAVSTAQTSYKSQKQATINQKASEYLQQSKEQAKALSAEPVITNKISIIS
ncbi:MAG: hypothetical protein NTZ95_04500, partial [Candidatus Omnitrophica bacterium]|nr:hypothetical protein [Candidatus Omnitrophota bacterium]